MTTTTTILPPPVQQKFSAKMLSTPQARLVHRLAAVPYRMPEGSGDILRMRRYARLETVPVPVNPAMMNPPSQLLTAVDVDAQIDWYAKTQAGVVKSLVIDLEAYSESHGDKGQATEKCAARTTKSRDSERRCDSLNIGRKPMRRCRRALPLSYTNLQLSYKSNRLTYTVITKQVTLINEDPKQNGVSKLLVIDLEAAA